MKKFICLVLALGLMMSLSSCAITSLLKKEVHIINGVEYKYNDQFFADTVDLLLTYIDEGNKEGVKSLLCQGLKDSKDIDANIASLVEGFEGDIVRTTKHETGTEVASSIGKNGNSAFLSKTFYVITDKQKYWVSVDICPLDETHDDGEDVVGIYRLFIKTLDYISHDVEEDAAEGKTAEGIKIANHNCYVASQYGDSSNYLVAQVGTRYDVIELYRIINPQSIVTYDDVTAWTSRDFIRFQERFGPPYAESLKNVMVYVGTDGYIYKISDSDKYAIVAVDRENGLINALSVKDIDSRWSKENQYERILHYPRKN